MWESMWRRIFPRREAIITRARPAPEAAPASAPTSAAADLNPENASPVPSLEQINEDFHRLVLDLPAAVSDEPSPTELVMLKRMHRLSAHFDLRSLPRLPPCCRNCCAP